MKFKVLVILSVLTIHNGFCQNFIKQNGRLQVIGHQLCNESGKPVQLRGFSTHNTTFCPECVSYGALKSNRDFWGVNCVRAAIYTDDWWNNNSYNKNPEYNKAMVDSIVRWSEMLGIYCIIDWHILTHGNPNSKIHAGADAFFEEMSAKYANKTHIIYELCNEPNGKAVTWDTIADYSNRIMPVIRKNDSRSVIIIGTPQWCQELDKVDPHKLKDTGNVMYAFHFYAATHQGLLPMFEEQIHRIPVFISEWGVCESNGNGKLDENTSAEYLKAMKKHIYKGDTVTTSWCLFSFGDKNETSSVLKPNSCKAKQWENMTPTGEFIIRWFKP